jgi:ring-1,2-phenylacetyl-CoA epoxidase subunit PaaD
VVTNPGAVLDRDAVFAILDTVMDPEVPVLSVVELGIVREVRVDDTAVVVVVTPTYSGCPAMHVIERDIVAALAERGIEARLETVYAPAWTTAWMSNEARAKLTAYGIAPPGQVDADDTALVPLRRRTAVVVCPYCASTNTRLESEFGSTACKSILYCDGCRQPFEQFKAL